MLLSATSPLLQAWYLRTHKGAVPYRLFALSNLGSMLALLTLSDAGRAVAHVALAGGDLVIGVRGVRGRVCLSRVEKPRGCRPDPAPSPNRDAPAPGLAAKLLWIGLAACASALLLAVTSHLTQNVAPIPLLWVAPLSLYLLSFILCFESDRLYQPHHLSAAACGRADSVGLRRISV